jgi:PAS domain S-box-containing protein
MVATLAEPQDRVETRRSAIWQLARLVETVRDYAIILLDVDGHVMSWNPGVERIKGYTAPQILGEHFSIFYTHEDQARGRPQAMLEQALRDGSAEMEGWRVRSDGSRFWADVTVLALRDDDGNLLGFGKVTRDLTERRRAHEELELFASSAAHDLQEPLRTISGFAELLLRRHGDELDREAQEFVEHITSATRRMQSLIGDLLAFARSGDAAGHDEPVALARALEAAMDHLAGAIFDRGVTVRTSIPPEAAVIADVQGIEQVLQNLLSNAIKYGDTERPEVIVVAELDEDGCWRVAVTDNGAGVPEEERERIFEPFTQVRRGDFGGTGLGLSICRRIVSRHAGSIGVEPVPSGGSRFWFRLPSSG